MADRVQGGRLAARAIAAHGGVAVVTAGPGVTGTITAVANSFVAQTPLLVIGGARPLGQAERGALQDLDQLSLFRPVTKWAGVCTDTERIPELVATAFRHALALPRGPTYLELPMDVLFAEAPADAQVGPSRSAARAFGDPREVMKAAELLTNAERPAVVAGSGIWWDGAWKQLDAFAANGRLPVYLNGSDRDEWLARLRDAEAAWWDEHRAQMESDAAPIHHYRLAAELDRVLDPGTVVVGDGGDVVAVVSRVLRVHRPGHWLDPGPFGCLGVGPPYALGVKTAAPAKQVVVVAGDGAFGLNGFEYDTLARFELPTVFVIGNDAAWGEIRIPQIGIYGAESEVATRLAPTPYHRLTDVFGGHAEHVERAAELAPALERALAADTPAIVNVMLDPDAMVGHPYRGM